MRFFFLYDSLYDWWERRANQTKKNIYKRTHTRKKRTKDVVQQENCGYEVLITHQANTIDTDEQQTINKNLLAVYS
jgi:hypothetical protein